MTAYDYTWIDLYGSIGWDESQLVTISIVQRVMGTISVIGSAYVIQNVLRCPQKRKHTFHRLMVGLSIADILSSFIAHVLSTSPIPKGYHVLAVGNVATCDVQEGFFTFVCFFVTPLYNCSLATYYLVQLKYNWADKKIKALEKWLHVVPWSVGLAFGITGLVFKIYGPYGFSCMAATPYPLGCNLPDSTTECIRGIDAHFYISIVILCNLCFAICYVNIAMYLTYKSVADIEKKARRYSFVTYTRSQTINERKRSHRVLIQGLLYSLALFLVNVFLTIIIGLARFGIRIYALNILTHAFWPLQGFFNALIYSIPNFQRTYTRYRQRKKEKIRKGSNNKSSTNIGEKFPLALDEINEVVIDEEEGKKVDSEEEKEEIVKTCTPDYSSAGILSDQAEGNAAYNYFDTDGNDNDIDDYIAISSG